MSLTPEQKAFRASGIGGTDAAELAIGSPFKVYGSKKEGHELEDSLQLLIGRVFEEPMRIIYAHQTGAKVFPSMMVRHPRQPIAIGSLDGRAERDGSERVLELKTANFRMANAWGDGEDEVPERYLLQCQWYMGVTGLAQTDLGVLLGGADFHVYTLSADPELFGMLLEMAERFWRNHIIPGRPPPPDASDAAREWLARKFPKPSGVIVPATDEAEHWAKQLKAARAAYDAAEAAKTEAENRLKMMIGDAQGIQGSGWKASWSLSKGKPSLNLEALLAEAKVPRSLVEKHTKRNPYRMFRPTFAKESSNEE